MTESDDLYNEILANAPSSGTLLVILSRLKESGHLKRVIQECLKALRFDPAAVQIRKLLAETLFEDGRVSQAERETEEVTREIRNLMSVYRLQAEIYRRQNRSEEALSALQRYLSHQPDDREAMDLFEALKPAEEVPGKEPPSAVEETGPVKEAIPDQETPPVDEEGLPDIATPTLAEVYFNQGQLREAIETYERVTALHPEDQKSRGRLEELRAMVVPGPSEEDLAVERKIEKNRKMISVLEVWLANIRKISETSSPA